MVFEAGARVDDEEEDTGAAEGAGRAVLVLDTPATVVPPVALA